MIHEKNSRERERERGEVGDGKRIYSNGNQLRKVLQKERNDAGNKEPSQTSAGTLPQAASFATMLIV